MFNGIKKRISKVQFIALGFLIIILFGTTLLLLPFSTREGLETSFMDALFTSVSATCVTGLVTVDTYSHWTLFGQIVILIMIQLGGLGFMSIGIIFAVLLKRKVSLSDRGLMQESVNTLQIGGIVGLTKKIIFGTMFFEGLGAIVLAIRFCGELGVGRAVFYGIFHSVSAFCNGGFDLFGFKSEYNSLVGFEGDVVVNITLCLLILIGGIGFIVWDDISKNKLHIRKYSLHTKIVLSMTCLITIVGTFLFWLFEKDNVMAGYDGRTAFFASLFSSITPRTAGFNTIDTAALSNSSKLLTMILMFIGGNPGSTAGGAKTTTIFILIAYVVSNIKNSYGIDVFDRRIKEEAVKKASLVVTVNVSLFLLAAIIIMGVQPELDYSDVFFEVLSGINTVGMTTGITRDLNVVSKICVMFLMYFGRIGSLSFALSFSQRKRKAPLLQPEEEINIG